MKIPAYVKHLVIAILFILAAINFSKTTLEVVNSSKRLEELRNQVSTLEEEKENLQEEIEYKKTDEYVEYEARNKFGFVREGEEIFVYPKVLSQQSHNLRVDPVEKTNAEQWLDLFF